MKFRTLLILVAILLFLPFAVKFLLLPKPFTIYDKPLPFPPEREEMTKNYIEAHYGFRPETIAIQPEIIVLHWTGIDGFRDSWERFAPLTLVDSRPDIADAGAVNVSVHFLVARNGTVYRLMPETRMGRHVIGLNYCAIGVENAGGSEGNDDLTDAQVKADANLVRNLKERFPTIQYLIGHHEYLAFEHLPLWREKDPDYRTTKYDPGARFMERVRAEVADLGLEGPPDDR